jgi:hypothetical protein
MEVTAMATASSDMTLKLVKDLRVVGDILKGMKKFIASVDESPNEKDFNKLQLIHDKIEPQISNFEKGLGK